MRAIPWFVVGAIACGDKDALIDTGPTELEQCSYWADADGDGYGDEDSEVLGDCDVPPDGAVEVIDDIYDCDDGDYVINPGAAEVCDRKDNDCNGDIDGSDAVDAVTWYRDTDEDGYGDAEHSTQDCEPVDGFVYDDTDCDDDDPEINPANDEICNFKDDNCDGSVDPDDSVDAGTWYADSDDDGYGDASRSAVSCSAPHGYVEDNTDCDDENGTVHPGATEVCNDVDDDCDGFRGESPSIGFSDSPAGLTADWSDDLDATYSDMTVELWVAGEATSEWPSAYMLTSYDVAGTGPVWIWASASEALTDGEWHHVAKVWDESEDEVRLYVDGIEEEVLTYSEATIGEAGLWIGGGHTTDGNYYNGSMQGIRVSDQVLYSESFTPSISYTVDGDTMLFLPLTEGSPSAVIDQGLYGIDITVGSTAINGSLGPFCSDS